MVESFFFILKWSQIKYEVIRLWLKSDSSLNHVKLWVNSSVHVSGEDWYYFMLKWQNSSSTLIWSWNIFSLLIIDSFMLSIMYTVCGLLYFRSQMQMWHRLLTFPLHLLAQKCTILTLQYVMTILWKKSLNFYVYLLFILLLNAFTTYVFIYFA